MRTRAGGVACVLAGVLIALWMVGQAQPPLPNEPRLDDPNGLLRQAAASKLVQQASAPRHAVIEHLMGFAGRSSDERDAEFFAAKFLAMNCLGELRAEEAIPLLIRGIEYRPHEVVSEDSPFLGAPAARALARIGLPSVVRILRADVVSDASPEALRRYALVIRYVFPDAKTAKAFVDAYDPGYTPEARAKLDELKKELAKLP